MELHDELPNLVAELMNHNTSGRDQDTALFPKNAQSLCGLEPQIPELPAKQAA